MLPSTTPFLDESGIVSAGREGINFHTAFKGKVSVPLFNFNMDKDIMSVLFPQGAHTPFIV